MKLSKNSILAAVLIVGAVYGYATLYYRAEKESLEESSQGWKDRTAKIQVIESQQKILAEKIKGFAGSGECKSNSECKTIGMGAKVCDGYLSFYHYSIHTIDPINFFSAIKEFNENQERLIKLSFKSSPCGPTTVPSKCYKNRCTPMNVNE